MAAARALRRVALLLLLSASCCRASSESGPALSDERIVFQTDFGDIEMALFPEVAPVTSAHILRLARLGAYNSNHFFRVDKGFVAQVADVMGGRLVKLDQTQSREGAQTVPGEFSKVKHVRGILSMGRYDDPNSATSSFSILLGAAPHLDEKYAVFGTVTAGWDVLDKMEQVETRREGIFVMPKERITIHSTYVTGGGADDGAGGRGDEELRKCKERSQSLLVELHSIRARKLPSAL